MYTVYKITCKINGKLYIGITGKTTEERWKTHVKESRRDRSRGKLHSAIRKYGKDNFSRESIDIIEDKDTALFLEVILIALYNTQKEGYNITEGGECPASVLRGRKCSPESVEKRAASLRGRPLSVEHKQALCGPRPSIVGEKNPFFGKKHSEETKRRIANRPYARGTQHYLFGKPTATSFKEGAAHPRAKSIIIDGVTYGSVALAARTLGISSYRLEKQVSSSPTLPARD